MTFENDEAPWEHFVGLLREGLEELHARLGGVPFTTVEDAVVRMRSAEKWPMGDDARLRELAERTRHADSSKDPLQRWKDEVGTAGAPGVQPGFALGPPFGEILPEVREVANVTQRRRGQFLRKLFEMLAAEPDGLRARTAIERLAESFDLSEYESGAYSGGGRRFDKIVRLATVDCVKAGWMVKEKGTWSITDEGRKAYTEYHDPEEFYVQACRLYRAWRKVKSREGMAEEEGLESVDGRTATQTFEQAEEQAWQEIEEHLRNINPYELQRLVGSLLEAMGYHVGWIAPPGKDCGIDVLAYTDPLGTKPPRIKVQVKRHQQKISVDGLRSFLAVLGDEDVGIFVNVGGFTRDAEDEARTQEKRRVTLIDASKLVDLWIEHYNRLDEAAKQHMPLRPIYFLAPEG